MKEINLLPRRNLGILEQERTVMIVRAIAVLSVIIVVSAFAGTFILGKNYSVSDVQTQQASVRSKMQIFHDKSLQVLLLSDRVNRIQSILKKRYLLTDKISLIQQKIPSDVRVDALSITTANITLSLSSASLTSLKTFLDAVSGLVAQKQLLQKVTIENVSIDSLTGRYTVNVQGTLL